MENFYSVHTHFESLQDTANNLQEGVINFIKAGYKRVAVTDHGECSCYEDLCDIVDKIKKEEKTKAAEENREPDPAIMDFNVVFGIEGYLNDGIAERSHVILIAKNEEGYHELSKVITESHQNKDNRGFPIMTFDMLQNHVTPGNVICTSACIGGTFGYIYGLKVKNTKKKLEEIETNFPNWESLPALKGTHTRALNEYTKASEAINIPNLDVKMYEKYCSIFGEDNFYLELQNHGLEEEADIYGQLAKLGDKLDHKPKYIASNDIHVTTQKSDPNFQKALNNRRISRYRRFRNIEESRGDEPEYCIKTADEIKEELSKIIDNQTVIDEAIQNTSILETCKTHDEYSKDMHLPVFNPNWTEKQVEEYFMQQIEEGKQRIFGDNYPSPEYEERINREIAILKEMKYLDYLLIVQDYSKQAPTGPGRGSAAGSLACYLLGITEIDPIKYDLLFERFLNPERVSMPDIDMDFTKESRDRVIEYCIHKYGEPNCSKIMTKSYAKIKGAIREAARYLGDMQLHNLGIADRNSPEAKPYLAPYLNAADKLTKQLDADEEQFWSDYAEVEVQQNQNEIVEDGLDASLVTETELEAQILDLGKDLTGVYMNNGIHACGILISKDPIADVMPMRTVEVKNSNGEKEWVLQTSCTYPQAEAKGILKMDFLGLITLDMIQDCIKKTGDFKVNDITKQQEYLNDPNIYKNIFSKGLTIPVFQFASKGMRQMLIDFKPTCFEDIILLVAAYRPGPLDALQEIIRVKQFREKNPGADLPEDVQTPSMKIKNPILQEIVSPTYGAIIYQEQVMKIFQELAGYSLGSADLVRRAMGKKHMDEIEREEQAFLYGDPDRNIEGCIKKAGLTEQEGKELFNQMREFAKYAFNKSHAAAYALLAVKTAYLLNYHPQQWICSYLNFASNPEKRIQMLTHARDYGIKILPPDVSKGFTKHMVEGNDIRFGAGYLLGYSFDPEDNPVPRPNTVEGLLKAGITDARIKSYIKDGLVKEIFEGQTHFEGSVTNDWPALCENVKNVYKSIEKAQNALTKTEEKCKKVTNELKTLFSINELTIESWANDGVIPDDYIQILSPGKDRQRAKTLLKNYIAYTQEQIPDKRDTLETLQSNWEFLKQSVFDYPTTLTPEQIIEQRSKEMKNYGYPFYKINESLDMLSPYKTEYLEDKSIVVPATIVKIGDLEYTKNGNPFYRVSLLANDGTIYERRFKELPKNLTAIFTILPEEKKYYPAKCIEKPIAKTISRKDYQPVSKVEYNGTILECINIIKNPGFISKEEKISNTCTKKSIGMAKLSDYCNAINNEIISGKTVYLIDNPNLQNSEIIAKISPYIQDISKLYILDGFNNTPILFADRQKSLENPCIELI